MKIKDLKNGMLVELVNGRIYMKFGDSLINKDVGWIEIDKFDENLEYIGDVDKSNAWDIKRVSSVLEGGDQRPSNWAVEVLRRKLIWTQRDKTFDVGTVLETSSGAGTIKIVVLKEDRDSFKGVIISSTREHQNVGEISSSFGKNYPWKIIKQ